MELAIGPDHFSPSNDSVRSLQTIPHAPNNRRQLDGHDEQGENIFVENIGFQSGSQLHIISTLLTRLTVSGVLLCTRGTSGQPFVLLLHGNMGYLQGLNSETSTESVLMKMETKLWVDNRRNFCSGVHVATFFSAKSARVYSLESKLTASNISTPCRLGVVFTDLLCVNEFLL